MVFAILGLAYGAAAFYGWNSVEDLIPTLNEMNPPSSPEFPFRSVEEWRTLSLRRFAFWGAFGLSFVICGIGLSLFQSPQWRLSLFSAGAVLVGFVLELLFAPWLWREDIFFPLMALSIFGLYYSVLSRNR